MWDYNENKIHLRGSLYSILSTTFNINLDSDSAWAQVPLCSQMQLQSHAYNTKINVFIFMEHIGGGGGGGGGGRPPYPNIGGPVAPPDPPPPFLLLCYFTCLLLYSEKIISHIAQSLYLHCIS